MYNNSTIREMNAGIKIEKDATIRSVSKDKRLVKWFGSFLLLFLMTFCGVHTYAQTTVTSSGMTSVSCPAVPTVTWTTPPTGTTFSQLSRGSGVTCGTNGTGISGSGFADASTSVAFAANRFYYMSISTNGSTSFTLSSMTIGASVSTSAAGNTIDVQYSIGIGPRISVGTITPTSTATATYTLTPAQPIYLSHNQILTYL